MKQLALILCLALVSGAALAQKVYKVIQPDGTVMFTDSPQPGDGAEEVAVQPLNTTPALASPRDAFDDSPAAELEKGYAEFRITNPEANASIRDNAGNVNVDVSINPKLRSGDKVELKLDGQSIGGGKKTNFALTDMERGTHSLQAVVKNSAGKVVASSESITFTLQRRSKILQPSQPRAVPFGGGG
jgi:hypothetical protein